MGQVSQGTGIGDQRPWDCGREDGDEAQLWGKSVRLRWLNQGQRVGRVSVGARDSWEWTSSRKD